MLANEVLDVMPVKLFCRGGVTFERGVVIGPDGGFAFDERRASVLLCGGRHRSRTRGSPTVTRPK